MTHCDRCGGTEGKIDRSAHVAPDQCIRAFRKQMSDACGTINEMLIARNEARAIVRRLANEHPSKRSALERDAREVVAKWALEEKGGVA